MADNVSNELLLEHLKSIQKQLVDVRGAISDLSSDMRGVKSHQAGFMSSELAQDGAIADLKDRMDRVEERLNLRDQ